MISSIASNIQNYVSGIFSCANFTAVNHGVLAVGYGTDSATNTDYYIIKNRFFPSQRGK